MCKEEKGMQAKGEVCRQCFLCLHTQTVVKSNIKRNQLRFHSRANGSNALTLDTNLMRLAANDGSARVRLSGGVFSCFNFSLFFTRFVIFYNNL